MRSESSAALNWLLRQALKLHEGLLRWTLRRLTRGDAARAEDLVQRAYIKLSKRLGQHVEAILVVRRRFGLRGAVHWQEVPEDAWRAAGFQSAAGVRSWLHTVVLRQFLKDRRRGPAPPCPEEAGQPGIGPSDSDQPDPPRPDPPRQKLLRELWERILAALSKQQRVVVDLHCEGYSDAEIAERLGTTARTVNTARSRARAKVKKVTEEFLAERGLTFGDLWDDS